MEPVLTAIAVVLAVAVVVVWIYFNARLRAAAEKLQISEAAWKEKTQIIEQQWSQKLADEQRHSHEMIEQMQTQIEQDRENAHRLAEKNNEQWQLKLNALKEEFLKAATEQMVAGNEQLRRNNTSSIDELMRPIREQFEAFRRSVEETKTQNAVSTKALQDKFDSTLRLFQQQQEDAIKHLTAETTRIGNDAVALAKALKSDNKRQGNWGEMVLKTILENSGLVENEHFFPQYTVKDEMGKRNIPDVVVKFPEGRTVIIDSKVSLTAYTRSFETDDEAEREQLLREHLYSVQRHVDELSIKNYPRTVENSGDYVMMFIPNESSYIAAVKMCPDLLIDAYNKKVIVISPNNLMMALQLIYNMWQNDKQIRNVDEIVKRGTKLYEKVVNFQTTFDAVGEQITKLSEQFKKADAQLYNGAGSVMRQCEMLRDLGVDSPKKLKGLDSEA